MLDQRRRRDENRGRAQAQAEHSRRGGSHRAEGHRGQYRDAHSAQTVHHQVLLRDVPGKPREQLRPDDHADADQGIEHTEHRGRGVQHVAHVDGEQGAEAAHREHARRHRENHKRDRRVLEDEAESLPHRIEHRGRFRAQRRAVDGQRHHQRRRKEETEAVVEETGVPKAVVAGAACNFRGSRRTKSRLFFLTRLAEFGLGNRVF